MFRVKGEVGCFSIPLYSIGDSQFPGQRTKQHYRTKGYLSTVIHKGVSKSSYREVCDRFNHTVRQTDQGGIIPTSVRYETTVEAKKLETCLINKTNEILSAHHFEEDGSPSAKVEVKELKEAKAEHLISKDKLKIAFNEIQSEANEYIQPLLSFNQLKASNYENICQTTYIGLDDVCNKKQKASRAKEEEELTGPVNERQGGKKKYKKRKFIYHTVVKVFTATQNYTLTAPKIGLLWSTLIALLLHNNRLPTFWIALVDGQRSLQDFILKRLKWRQCRLLLDWYHLRKKIHSQIHMGLKKNGQRDIIMFKIEQLLWYGMINQAIEEINQIPKEAIKDAERLRILTGYFERNRAFIPNYALRKKLGLILSSNRVEKENDFIVAARQKHNGMSWTRTGSDAIALISANNRNKELEFWLNSKDLNFKLAAA